MLNRSQLPIEALPAWAHLNGIKFHDRIGFEKLDNGSGIVAKKWDGGGKNDQQQEKENGDRMEEEEDGKAQVLITVPPDMVLSLELVHEYAKSDPYLREVLEAIGDFGWVWDSVYLHISKTLFLILFFYEAYL